jgi:hypothetical protein
MARHNAKGGASVGPFASGCPLVSCALHPRGEPVEKPSHLPSDGTWNNESFKTLEQRPRHFQRCAVGLGGGMPTSHAAPERKGASRRPGGPDRNCQRLLAINQTLVIFGCIICLKKLCGFKPPALSLSLLQQIDQYRRGPSKCSDQELPGATRTPKLEMTAGAWRGPKSNPKQGGFPQTQDRGLGGHLVWPINVIMGVFKCVPCRLVLFFFFLKEGSTPGGGPPPSRSSMPGGCLSASGWSSAGIRGTSGRAASRWSPRRTWPVSGGRIRCTTPTLGWRRATRRCRTRRATSPTSAACMPGQWIAKALRLKRRNHASNLLPS